MNGLPFQRFSDQQFFHFLLKNIPDQIYFKDREGRLLCISDAGAKFLSGQTAEHVIGKSDFDLLAPGFASEARKLERQIMETGEPMVGKIEKVVHTDGRVSWNYTTKLPLRDSAGEICGIFGVNKDFGPIHEMEETILQERNRLKVLTAELQSRNAQLQADLQMAREVQEALLPREYPSWDQRDSLHSGGFAFAHCYRPAESVGGDFLDIVSLPGNRYGVFICDVMGHGMRAALVTAVIRGLLEELRSEMDDPGGFMSILNARLRTILQNVEESFIATGFFLLVDESSNEVRYANAGHPVPVGICNRGVVTTLQNAKNRPKSALGLFDHFTYVTECCPCHKGDRIFLFTDGLYEVESPQGQEFGRNRLHTAFQKYAQLPPRELFSSVFCDLSAFSDRNDFADDICIILLERL
ncbi:MAG: SpoIIE family protein phosphatase [Chthoniobacteraceae bacterium]